MFNGNLVFVVYFYRQEARSSSFDSDGEMEQRHLMRGISQEDHHPSTPGAIRKLSVIFLSCVECAVKRK